MKIGSVWSRPNLAPPSVTLPYKSKHLSFVNTCAPPSAASSPNSHRSCSVSVKVRNPVRSPELFRPLAGSYASTFSIPLMHRVTSTLCVVRNNSRTLASSHLEECWKSPRSYNGVNHIEYCYGFVVKFFAQCGRLSSSDTHFAKQFLQKLRRQEHCSVFK